MQKNYTKHTTQDIEWIAQKMREIAGRVSELSQRMQTLGIESVELLDRATLDKSLTRVADWSNKAASAIDEAEVARMSRQVGKEQSLIDSLMDSAAREASSYAAERDNLIEKADAASEKFAKKKKPRPNPRNKKR